MIALVVDVVKIAISNGTFDVKQIAGHILGIGGGGALVCGNALFGRFETSGVRDHDIVVAHIKVIALKAKTGKAAAAPVLVLGYYAIVKPRKNVAIDFVGVASRAIYHYAVTAPRRRLRVVKGVFFHLVAGTLVEIQPIIFIKGACIFPGFKATQNDFVAGCAGGINTPHVVIKAAFVHCYPVLWLCAQHLDAIQQVAESSGVNSCIVGSIYRKPGACGLYTGNCHRSSRSVIGKNNIGKTNTIDELQLKHRVGWQGSAIVVIDGYAAIIENAKGVSSAIRIKPGCCSIVDHTAVINPYNSA